MADHTAGNRDGARAVHGEYGLRQFGRVLLAAGKARYRRRRVRGIAARPVDDLGWRLNGTCPGGYALPRPAFDRPRCDRHAGLHRRRGSDHGGPGSPGRLGRASTPSSRRTGRRGPTEVRMAAARTSSGRRAPRRWRRLVTRCSPAAGASVMCRCWATRRSASRRAAPAGGWCSNAGHGFVFRFGRHLIGAIVTGPSPPRLSISARLRGPDVGAARRDARARAGLRPNPAPVRYRRVDSPAVPASSTSASANAASTVREHGARPPNAAARRRQLTGAHRRAAAIVPAGVTVATVVADVRLDDAPELSNGFKLGGFSGLAAPDASGTTSSPSPIAARTARSR